jgi:hypothetical protein
MDNPIETLVEEVRALREELRDSLAQQLDIKTKEEKLYSSKETAEILNIKPQTLHLWRSKSKGPSYIMVGRNPKYTSQSIKTYLAHKTVKY